MRSLHGKGLSSCLTVIIALAACGGSGGPGDSGVDSGTGDAGLTPDAGDGGGSLEDAGDGGGLSDAGDGGDRDKPDGGDGGETLDGGDGGQTADSGVDSGLDSGLTCGACGQSQTCCSGTCTDVTTDIQNCGACGVACTQSQFCDGTICQTVAWSGLCDNPAASVLIDGVPDDDDGGAVVGQALASGCSPDVAVTYIGDPDTSGLIDPSTGAPLVGGGDLLVASGGPYYQQLVGYLENGISPVYFQLTGQGASQTAELLSRQTNQPLVSALLSDLGASHDYLLLELVRDPISGTLSLVSYGFTGYGTEAAGWYFANKLLTDPPSGSAWSIYEWTASDGGTPYVDDTFSQVASG